MKYDSKTLMNTAEKLVQFGKSKGADEIQVSINRSNDFSVEVMDGEIEKLQEAASTSLSLKIILDKKVATASSSDLTDDTLKDLTLNAIKRASYTNSDPFSGLPDNEELNAKAEELAIYDEAVMELSPEKKIRMAKELEKICLSEKKVSKSVGSFYGTGEREYFLANSNGFSDSFKGTSASAGVYLQAGEKDNMFEDGWWDSSVSVKGLMSINEIAVAAVNRVIRLIGARKVETQNVPVVMEPPMTAGILRFLSSCLSGNMIYKKHSFLADKLGETIADSKVNIIDDGLMPGRPGTKPFDREGVPCRKTKCIENGVLKSYLLDTYSARKLDLKSTGNASGANNLYLGQGDSNPGDIIRSVDKGLYLTKTIGQGTVPTTGDISKGAYGLWIEKGELTYPVFNITFSGNLGNMLKNISMIGNDLEFSRRINGPTIKIDDLTISGK